MLDPAGQERLKGLLLDELAERQGRNPAYSLRAFSRDLSVNVTSLSQFFSGRRGLSKEIIERLAKNLGFSPLIFAKTKGEEVNRLPEETFRVISEWYYYGILNLARVKKNRAAPEWIAKRLGITTVTARVAVRRLVELGLLKTLNGRLVRTARNLTTTHGVPSEALRHYHKQNLNLAIDAIDREPIDRRFVTSITMATDTKRMSEAKEMILRFREEISRFLETGEPVEVYTLAFQLFPLTKRTNA